MKWLVNGDLSIEDAPKDPLRVQCCGTYIGMMCSMKIQHRSLSLRPADEHQLYSSARNISDVSKGLEEDGTTTDKWYRSSHLTGNLLKYRAMFMSRGEKEEYQGVGLRINNHLVQQTQEIKLLAVVQDNGLQFSEHVQQDQ